MQEGIGRGGYRVLAYVFAGLGLVGLLVMQAGGGGASQWLGLLLTAVALVALAGLVLVALGLPDAGSARPARAEAHRAPDGPVALETPQAPAEADPSADIGFEYADPSPAPAPPASAPTAPSTSPWAQANAPIATNGSGGSMEAFSFEAPPQPAPPSRTPPFRDPPRRPASNQPPPRMAPPRAASAPPAGKPVADAGAWPQRKGAAGVTRRQLAETSGVGLPPSRRDLPRDPGPTVEVEGPGPVRREPPIVMARTVASAEATGIPEGTGVGKCGNCGVLLLAPKKRPIRLQCPRCERVHLLS